MDEEPKSQGFFAATAAPTSNELCREDFLFITKQRDAFSDSDSMESTMKRLLVGLTVLVFLGGLGYLARTLQAAKSHRVDQPTIKNTSLRLANGFIYETTDKSPITFKELFDKLEVDIGEIDKRILEVQTIAAPGQKSIADSTVEYMALARDR